MEGSKASPDHQDHCSSCRSWGLSDKASRNRVQNHMEKQRLTCGTPHQGMLQKE